MSSDSKYQEEVYQTQYYTSLRVGWIKKNDQIGFVLNPFNFTYYGSIENNKVANYLISVLSEKFKDFPMTIETLIEADKWLQQNQHHYI